MHGILKHHNQKPQISDSSSSDENKSAMNENTSAAILTHSNAEIVFPESVNLITKKTKTKEGNNDGFIYPRFTILHNAEAEKKHLDNHSFEDYFFYDIVDEKSFKTFKTLTKNFVTKRLNDKTVRLYSSLKRQIAEIIQHGLKQIHTYPEFIPKVVKKTLNQNVKKESFCAKLCKCCSKPKVKANLENEHKMQQSSETIDGSIVTFAEALKDNFTDKNIENMNPVNKEEIESFAKKKSNVFFNKKGMEERLREEADNYSKYFNIKKIIEKQECTLDSQKHKMNKLHETKELNECIICMEKQRNVIFFPCYHLICCQNCGVTNVSDECPECKKKIEQKLLTN